MLWHAFPRFNGTAGPLYGNCWTRLRCSITAELFSSTRHFCGLLFYAKYLSGSPRFSRLILTFYSFSRRASGQLS